MTEFGVTEKHPRYFISPRLLGHSCISDIVRLCSFRDSVPFLSCAVRVRQYVICVCMALGLFAGTACADPFEDVVTLAQQGMPALALRLVDQQQVSAHPMADDWAAWEKARILIYQQRRDWPSVIRRTQSLVSSGIFNRRSEHDTVSPASDNVSMDVARWILMQGAVAQLELDQGAAAREWLLRLLWQPAVQGCASSECAGAPAVLSAQDAAPVQEEAQQVEPSGVMEHAVTAPPECTGVTGCADMTVSVSAPPGVDSHVLRSYRRMIIHSYIVDGRVDDAYTAMLRYQQDYGNADVPTRVLQARVLLLAGRAADAAALLRDMQHPAARAVYLLARLRSNGRPENILQEAHQLAKQQGVSVAGACVSCVAWAVQAEAAQLIGDHERRVEALEYMLALYDKTAPRYDDAGCTDHVRNSAAPLRQMPLQEQHPGDMHAEHAECINVSGLFNISSDAVWDAYVAYAQILGNQQQLLMGDFEPWFVVAQSMLEKHPLRARAMFAFLALQADTIEVRTRAHQQLIGLLGQHAPRSDQRIQGAQKPPQDNVLMRSLYLALDRFH